MRDSGLDEALGELEVNITLRLAHSHFKDSHMDDRWNALINMVLTSDFLCTLYQHGFGGEEVGWCWLVSDEHYFPVCLLS